MHSRLLIGAATALAAACGPRPAASPAPVPAPAPAGGQPAAPPTTAPARSGEVVRLGPSALRYVVHQRTHIEQEFQGMSQPLDVGVRVFLATTITGPADTSGYPTTFTIDSVVVDSGTTLPAGVNPLAAKGLSYRGRLGPNGEFKNPVPSDSVAAALVSPVMGQFRSFFPRIPAGGLTLGAAWTDTVVTRNPAAGGPVVTAIARSTATTWEERAGTRSLRLDVSATYTIQGAGEQMGQPYEVTGTGVRTAVNWIAVDGRYLGGESKDSTTMTITLPVQAMTIPRREVSRGTITILP